MKKFLIVFGVIVVVVLIIIGLIARAGVGGYNRLVGLSQGVDSSWAQVQNDYQRRDDLIPNLVATVSGAANFEKSTLTAVTEARASVGKVSIRPKHRADGSAEAGAISIRRRTSLARRCRGCWWCRRITRN